MNPLLFRLWNFWPPFFGAGIKIDSVSKDLLSVRTRLKKRFWNRNLVGTAYGGSIYSMVDPFYMAMLLYHLKRDYIVWDKSSNIRFRKPGTKDLIAEFTLTLNDIAEIKKRLETEPKMDWEKLILIKDTGGVLVAEVNKVIHVRKK